MASSYRLVLAEPAVEVAMPRVTGVLHEAVLTLSVNAANHGDVSK